MAIMKQEEQRSTPHYNTHHHLHAVQQSSKITKKPLPIPASGGPTQPKVYKVKPIHFRELVQQLTGAQPESMHQQQQPLQQRKSPPQPRPRRTPPPLPPLQTLHPHQLQLQLQSQAETTTNQEKQQQLVKCKVEEQDYKQFTDKLQNSNGVGTTELILSPNFQAWFSFAMMSPGSAALSQMQ